MNTFNSIKSATFSKPTVVTVGSFDGIHLGHQKIVKELLEISSKEDLEAVMLTFSPHPKEVIFPNKKHNYLTTENKRQEVLNNLGLKNLIVEPFTKSFSKLSAEEFILLLVEKLNMKYFVIGYDHRFANNQSGNFDKLKELAKKYHFKVKKVEPEVVSNEVVSSTEIKKLLEKGDVQKVQQFLGRNYSISGEVVVGDSVARGLGFPTANIRNNENIILPKNGVYFVKVLVDKSKFFGMMNIGFRPTIFENREQVSEVHILDFDKEIYGKNLEVKFISWIRDEKQFESKEILKAQLVEDKKLTKNLISNYLEKIEEVGSLKK